MYLPVILLCYVASASAFSSPLTRVTTQLRMAGGRSEGEKVQTKKEMFRDLREKLDTAAQIPGFFDVGQKMDVGLYCKSTKDGRQISDCPESQFVQMVLLKKGIPYRVLPTLDEEKPKGVTQLPALAHKGDIIIDPLAIAEFIERTYPHTSLTRQGIHSYQEVLEKSANFFPVLTAYIKNKDDGKDEVLLAAFEGELDILDEILRTTPGQYLCGVELTLADLYLLPQLYHAAATVEHFKNIEFYQIEGNATRPALENYLARMFEMEEFNDKKAYYSVDQVVHGWKVIRGDKV